MECQATVGGECRPVLAQPWVEMPGKLLNRIAVEEATDALKGNGKLVESLLCPIVDGQYGV